MRSVLSDLPRHAALGVALALSAILATTPPSAAASVPIPSSFQLTAESANLRLYLDPATSQLIVEDKRNGKLWTSNPIAGVTGQRGPTRDQEKAVFFVYYTDSRRDHENYTDSALGKPKIALTSLPRGAAADYLFTDLGLGFRMLFQLGDDYLDVSIPRESLVEHGQNFFVGIEPLPFLGATSRDVPGYFVVPDGTGALVHFRPQQPGYRRSYDASVYGLASPVFGPDAWRSEQVSMPIFGEVAGDAGYLAILTEGALDASLEAAVTDSSDSLNRIAARFIVRRSTLYPRSRTTLVSRFDQDRTPTSYALRYQFLDAPNASYVGMARAYRQYLLTDREVPRLREPVYPLHLRFFMGVEKPAFPFPRFIQLTTYDQVIQILDALAQRGVDHVMVTLVGWEQGGFAGRWPIITPPDSRLGGSDGLRRLADYCAEHGDRLVLQAQYTWAVEGHGGFSARGDVVRGANLLPIYDRLSGRYVLNPIFAFEHYIAHDVPILAHWGAGGVLLTDVASIALDDHNAQHPLNREQYVAIWREILSYVRQQTGWIGVTGGNDYLVGATDHLSGLPLDRTDYQFFDESIPFLPIALHGLVTYSGTPANLQGDLPRDFLRQIEYGALPTFELTYAAPLELGDTPYNILFSSQYGDWLDAVVQQYQLARQLEATWTEFIVDHRQLAPNVFATTYEDGTRVLVNYGDGAYQDGARVVPAGGYAVEPGAASAEQQAGAVERISDRPGEQGG
jgi:hypothetical protein